MESPQDQPQRVMLPFSRVFLAWGCVTAGISAIPLLVFSVDSLSSALRFLAIAIFYGGVVGLCGAWLLTNSRPRELRSRRRFARILGFFLPIVLFLLLGSLGLGSNVFFFALLAFFKGFPVTFFLIAGSILGGDWAAQRIEGAPLPNFGKMVESFFRRG
jgi:hypothetical protein